MGIPNIQQQIYLKKALNENMDGMFDHPEVQTEETITEGLMGKIKSIVRKVKQRGLKGAVTKSGANAYVNDKIAGNRSAGQYYLKDKNTAAADKSYNKVAGYQKFSNKISEGSISAGKMFRGNKFHPEKDRKYYTKTAVRQLIKRGKDPNLIKIPTTQGLENYGFFINAHDKRVAALRAKGKKISEGSIGAGKIFSGKKGNKFHPEKDRKYYTKTAVRQLIKRGKDPNLIKISSTQGLENYGFHVNADDKRKAALRAKGKKA